MASLTPISLNAPQEKERASLQSTPLQSVKKEQPSSDGLFGTFLDIVNPLQHIPVISSIYQEASGDKMSSIANVLGGGLFGGPIGAAASLATEAIEAAAGETIGEMVMGGMEDITRPPVQLYAATSGSPLVPDNGLSARVIAVTGTTQESAIAPDLTTQNSEQVADTLHSMDRYRDAALDFKEPGKQEQLRMKLEKVAIDMKA